MKKRNEKIKPATIPKETPSKVSSALPKETKKKAKGAKPVEENIMQRASQTSQKPKDTLFKFIDSGEIPEKLILLQFVRWSALPKKLRDPETQAKFAEKYQVNVNTLSNWKLHSGFWDEVDYYTDKYLRSHRADLFYAMITTAKKNGDPRAVKFYEQRILGWSEKFRVADETPESELDADLKKQITQAIKHIGLQTIKEKYDDDNDETEVTD